MSFNSQSRVSNRGPLIAVITIQLDDQLNDKIYLHLNDDDMQKAQQFIDKHGINPNMQTHIYQRIRLSRKAIEEEDYYNNINSSKKRNGVSTTKKITQQQSAGSYYQKHSNRSNNGNSYSNHKQESTNYYDQKHHLKSNNVSKNMQVGYSLTNKNQTNVGRAQNYRKKASYNDKSAADYISYSDYDSEQNVERTPTSGQSTQERPRQRQQASHKKYKPFRNYDYSSDKLKLKPTFSNIVQDEQRRSQQNDQRKRSQQRDVESIRNKYNYGSSDDKGQSNKGSARQYQFNSKNQDIYSRQSYKIGQSPLSKRQTKEKPQFFKSQTQIQRQIVYSSSDQESSEGLFQKRISPQSKQRNESGYNNSKQRSGMLDYKLMRGRDIVDKTIPINQLNYSKRRRQIQQENQQNQQNQFIDAQKNIQSKNISNGDIQDHLPLGLVGRETANFKEFSETNRISSRLGQSLQPTLYPGSSSVSVDYISFKKPLKQEKPMTKYQKILQRSISPSYSKSISLSPTHRHAGLIRSNSRPQQSFRKKLIYENVDSKMKSNRNQNQSQNNTRRSPDSVGASQRQHYYNQSNNTLNSNAYTYQSDIFESQTKRKFYDNLNDHDAHQDLFKEIKDLHSVKENRPHSNNITKKQQRQPLNDSCKPSNVKFFNKLQLISMKQSNLNKSLSKAQLSRINKDVTTRLYNEQDIKKKYLNAIKSRALREQEIQDMENQQLTHRPEINHISKIIAEGRMKDKNLEDYLVEQGRNIQFKKSQMMSRQARNQIQKCTFKPQINQISQKLAASRSKSKVSRSVNRSRSYTQVQAPFKPEINKLSNQLAKDKGSFQERLMRYQEEKNGKLFKKRQQQRLKQKADIASGKQFYKPQVNEKSKKIMAKDTSREEAQDIYHYLYDLSKRQKKLEVRNNTPKISSESQKMVEQIHEKRLIWLFSELDSDQDGVISSLKICIDQIPTQILQLIAPVLYQMEQLKTELNLDDFKNAIKILNKNLNPYEKSILYNYKYPSKAIKG